jgi:hypothetical protein
MPLTRLASLNRKAEGARAHLGLGEAPDLANGVCERCEFSTSHDRLRLNAAAPRLSV